MHHFYRASIRKAMLTSSPYRRMEKMMQSSPMCVLVDAIGNRRYYFHTELAQLGFPTELVVTGQVGDVVPPTLTALSFTPPTINTAAGPAIVTGSVSATDDLSGVQRVDVVYKSPLGTVSGSTGIDFSPPATSGTGTWDVIFPQFSEVGTWTV